MNRNQPHTLKTKENKKTTSELPIGRNKKSMVNQQNNMGHVNVLKCFLFVKNNQTIRQKFTTCTSIVKGIKNACGIIRGGLAKTNLNYQNNIVLHENFY